MNHKHNDCLVNYLIVTTYTSHFDPNSSISFKAYMKNIGLHTWTFIIHIGEFSPTRRTRSNNSGQIDQHFETQTYHGSKIQFQNW